MAKVAFLGLGVMGYPMAGHLLKKGGHDVTVYNRTAAKAAQWAKEYGGKSAATPKEAAQGCDFVMMGAGVGGSVLAVLAGLLMLALHRSGRTTEAVQAYEQVAALLRAQLGVAPGEELTRLVAAIRRQDPTLAASRPGLPASRTRFIGRRAELDRVAALLGETRLLTVVGPGGCGKTRLAYQLAYEVEKNLKEHGAKLDGGLKSRIEAGVTAVRDALKGSDVDAVKTATESLEKAWHGVHYLLNGRAESQPGRLAGVIVGGTELGDDEFGYGPSRD